MTESPSPREPTPRRDSRDAYVVTDPACAERSARRQGWRRMRSPALGAALWASRQTFGRLSWGAAQRLGRGLGALAARLARRDLRRMEEHLALAFPELDAKDRRQRALACWRHLGTSLGELLHLRFRDPAEASQRVTVEGFETVEAVRAEQRPVLVLTGHCGNWELISTANHSHGLGLAAMGRANDDPNLARGVLELRQHLGTTTITRGAPGASRLLLKTLRSGGALALLIDQDFATDGVWVPFFGRLAFTPIAAAEIALRLGAAVVPTFAERLEDGQHRLRFHPPLDLPDDLEAATAVMTRAIEDQIRRRPEQWVWMHRRWRRRPPSESTRATSQETTE